MPPESFGSSERLQTLKPAFAFSAPRDGIIGLRGHFVAAWRVVQEEPCIKLQVVLTLSLTWYTVDVYGMADFRRIREFKLRRNLANSVFAVIMVCGCDLAID